MKSLFVLAIALGFTTAANAQFAITSHTIDGGGGTSSSASFALSGTIGQPEATPASTSGNLSLMGGFWKAILPTEPVNFEAWLADNTTTGQDMSFAGDADGDGFANGYEYVFGKKPLILMPRQSGDDEGTGRIPIPPVTPEDVTIILEVSFSATRSLRDWSPSVTWSSGGAPVFAFPLSTSISGNEIVDIDNFTPIFYRYRVIQNP